MDYLKAYYNIVDRAKRRQSVDGYSERHHILPKCLGGDDGSSNIVELTGREHFIVHVLLAKHLPFNSKIVRAVVLMSGKLQYGRNSRKYNDLRVIHSKNASKSLIGNTYAKGVSEANLRAGKEHSVRMLGNTHLSGFRHSDESKALMSKAHTGVSKGLGNKQSDRQRKKHSEFMKGKQYALGTVWTDGMRETLSLRLKGNTYAKNAEQQVVTCPHCQKVGKLNGMSSWHFDNCDKNPHLVKILCDNCGVGGRINYITRWHNDNCKKPRKSHSRVSSV